MRRGMMIGLVLVLGFGVAIALMRGFSRPSQAFVSTPSCKNLVANPSGVALADVVVTTDNTTVIPASTSYCGSIITNTDTTSAVRCNQLGTAPTATTGFKVLPFQTWTLDQESQLGISCIRSSDATGDVALTVMVVTQ